MNLKGKTAVVTGASDGLGKQVALKLAKEETSLAIVARDKRKLEAVKDKCLKLGAVKVKPYTCDIADRSEVKKTVNKILGDFKSVDILLNIAGIWQKLNQLENISEEEIDKVIDIDLKGMIYMTKYLLKHFKEKDKETMILNVSSRSGVAAQNGQAIYTAAKYGVTGFTEALKADLKETKVRIAGIYQGGTNTDMFRKAGDVFKQEHFIKPEDLAEVVLFMLSRPPQIWLHDVRVEY